MLARTRPGWSFIVSALSLFLVLGAEARAGRLSRAAVAHAGTADAFIDLGTTPYRDAGMITTGGAQPWYDSPAVAKLFGGAPNAQQQAAFDNTVVQRVGQTFALAGVAVNVTDNPAVKAPHELSVVSNTSAAMIPSALGMTVVGGNGFSFIDQDARFANSVNQLEWVVAHNVSHELMLAFGVGENYDQTGRFIDARVVTQNMLDSPSSTFSPAAAEALLARHLGKTSSPTQAAQLVTAETVPEPSTLAVWGLGLIAVASGRWTLRTLQRITVVSHL